MATANSTKTFNDRWASDLPITAKDYDATAPRCKGLHVRVRKSGHKSWWLWLYTPDHSKRYRWRVGDIGTFKVYRNTPSRKEDRERSIVDVAEGLKAQALNIDLRVAKRQAIAKNDSQRLAKLGNFIDLHYADLYKARGYAQPESMIRWFKNSFADMLDLRMDKITHLTIRSWTLKQQQTKKDGTVARLQSALSAILSEAVSMGYLPHHPLQKAQRDNATTKLKLAKPDKGIVRWLSADEENRLRTALSERDRRLKAKPGYTSSITGAYTDHLTPLVLIAMNTGIRRGALLGMKWEDISAGKIHVTKGLDKANKGYDVDMNKEVLEVLRLWKCQSGGKGLVFKHKGKQISSIKTAWGKLIKAAKIDNFRFHDLRHHFATRLAEAGAAPATIKELMGHSSIKMTEKYMHATDEMKSSAVELIRR